MALGAGYGVDWAKMHGWDGARCVSGTGFQSVGGMGPAYEQETRAGISELQLLSHGSFILLWGFDRF